MSKKPNNVLIGVFVAGAAALVVAAVLVFGSGSLFEDRNLFVLNFKGSVKGLAVGAPVVLRGVKIGSVRDIRINASSNSQNFSIPVIIEIGKELIIMSNGNGLAKGHGLSVESNLKALIEQGLRAQLEMQSMVTGQLLVSLDFHHGKPLILSGEALEYPEIPTIQTEIEELTQKIKQVPIEEMFNKLFSIISSVEQSFNKESIGQLVKSLSLTLESLNKISDSLDKHLPTIAADVQDTIKQAKVLVQNSNSQVTAVGSLLNQTIADTRQLINSATVQLDTTSTSINKTLNSTDKLVTNINNELSPISKTAKESMVIAKATLNTAKDAVNAAKKASEQAEIMFKGFDKVAGSDSVLINNLNNTLNDLSDAARSLRLLAEYLERNPEALIQGKQ
ncbi:MAG: MlaD family protein [Desulfamplus sp.]